MFIQHCSARRVLPLLAALFVLIGTSGCLTFLSTIKLNPDGSGQVVEEVRLSPMLAGMMKSMAQQADNADGSAQLFSEARVRENASRIGEGVQFVSMERLASGNGYRAVYAFEDINMVRLSRSPDARLPEDATEESGGAMDTPEGPLTFSFTPGAPATLTVHLPRTENEDAPAAAAGNGNARADSITAQQIALMRGMFANARMALSLDVQGTIVETNATHRQGNLITFYDVDFGKLLRDEGAFKAFMRSSNSNASRTEMYELVAELPGLKIEPQTTVRVQFR